MGNSWIFFSNAVSRLELASKVASRQLYLLLTTLIYQICHYSEVANGDCELKLSKFEMSKRQKLMGLSIPPVPVSPSRSGQLLGTVTGTSHLA